MELKDNFTNRYFKPENIKSQLDLINQPTGVDAMAEGLQRLGSQPAIGKSQRMSNALMTGIGSGLKASANDQRQEQINPLLKMTSQINAQNAYLEAQMQDQQQKAMQVKQLFSQNSYNLMNFSAANLAKDSNALNEISPALLRSYKQMFGDITIGSYSHTHDGTIFYENTETGKIDSVNIAQVIAQSGINPEELWGADASRVMAGLSAGARESFQNTQEMQRLALEKERAGIENTKSQANQHNAQATHLGMQDKKIESEIANPPLTPAQAKTKELNEGRFSKRTDEAEDKRILNNAYEQYIENILDAKEKGLTGKSPISTWKRFYAEKTGQSENMDVEEMLRITHANRVKELGGSNANQKQFEVAMASAPSITKDPDATIKFLDKVIEQNNEFLSETDYLGQTWESSNWQGQERSILNDYRSQTQPKEQKTRSTESDYVVMTNKETGEPMEVPANKVNLFKQNGYE
jgi:hypothetical protein